MFGEPVNPLWAVILAMALLLGALLLRILVRAHFLWRSCACRLPAFMNLLRRSAFGLLTQSASDYWRIFSRACIYDVFMPPEFRDAKKILSRKTANPLHARWTSFRSWGYTEVFPTKSSF